MNCLLCFKVNANYQNLIFYNSSEWQELNMQHIIEKHLWKLEVLNSQSYICQECWQGLHNFHQFYSKLKNVRSNLNDSVNTEKLAKAVDTKNEEDAEKIKDQTERKTKRKRSKKTISHNSRKRCNKDQTNTEINEVKSDANPDEIDTKMELEIIESNKSDESETNIGSKLEIKTIENDDKDNKMQVEEVPICLQRSTRCKCFRKKSTNDRKNIASRNSLRNISNNEISNIEIKELKSVENPSEIGKKSEIENEKSEQNKADIESKLELKTMENDAKDLKMENEEESICSIKKSKNVNKNIARNSLKQRTNKDKSDTGVKELQSVENPGKIEIIQNDAKENKMKIDTNLDELETKLELKITENDAKQNNMEEDEQNSSFKNYDDKPSSDAAELELKTKENNAKQNNMEEDDHNDGLKNDDDEPSSDGADSVKLDKLSDEDKFVAENFQITCNLCEIPLPTFAAMLKHYKREHNQRGHVSCCNFNFYLRVQLMDHIKFHQNPEYFKCKHCDKVFPKRAGLKTHTQKVHEAEVAECDICGKSYTNETGLRRHKLIHKTEDMLTCKQCGKSFLSQYSLKNHIRVHFKKHRICDLCGKSISTPHGFRRHMLQHEGKSPPKVNCKICGRILSDMSCLSRHMSSHHPPEGAITEFKCPECPKVFAVKYNLKTHIRSVHENKYARKCKICEKTFKGPVALAEHMSRHMGEPLYTCSFCPRQFYSSGNMHSHRKREHPVEWEKISRENVPQKTTENQ